MLRKDLERDHSEIKCQCPSNPSLTAEAETEIPGEVKN